VDPVQKDFENLKKKIALYFPDIDWSLLQKAFDLAEKFHRGQKRQSGEAYIHHPIAVTSILADMKMDTATLCVGLLHDLVEDTSISLNDIKNDFGETIAQLVDGLTKISKISFRSSHEKQAENFRKMLLAMAKDVRVVLVKLADRTHNMRTLGICSFDKQTRIAQETLDIYAPLANRLGISWLKIELEDLGLRYAKPETYKKIKKLVDQKKSERQQYIKTISELLHDKLKEFGLEPKITGRAKHFYSIHKKMESRNLSFEEIHDIIAFRMLTKNIAECYEALGIVHSFLKPIPGRFKDYIAMPKNNMYQSLHTTVVGPYGESLEIQMRTQEMHETAEQGIAAHWEYKDGKLDEKDANKFHWLRQMLEDQESMDNPREFIESVKLDLFASDIYVFTPKGEILEFPFGSTPLDFAYSIHTDVGNRCTGAKVNGRMVALKHRLKSGDRIEIITSAQQSPNKDWLKYVKTGRAKAKIRQFVKSKEREQAKVIGRDLLDREFRRHSKSLPKFEKLKDITNQVNLLSFANYEELLISIGYGKSTPEKILLKLFPELQRKEETKADPKEKIDEQDASRDYKGSKSAIKIQGIDGILVRLSKCCSPLPGDEIVGFISRGRGVSVHKVDCARLLELDSNREVFVEWSESAEKFLRDVKLRILCHDKPGIINHLSKVVLDLGVNVRSLNIKANERSKAIGTIDVQVYNKRQLTRCIHSIEKINGIISVERLRD